MSPPPKFTFIAFWRNNLPKKSRKFSKTATSAPFSGTSRPKILPDCVVLWVKKADFVLLGPSLGVGSPQIPLHFTNNFYIKFKMTSYTSRIQILWTFLLTFWWRSYIFFLNVEFFMKLFFFNTLGLFEASKSTSGVVFEPFWKDFPCIWGSPFDRGLPQTSTSDIYHSFLVDLFHFYNTLIHVVLKLKSHITCLYRNSSWHLIPVLSSIIREIIYIK